MNKLQSTIGSSLMILRFTAIAFSLAIVRPAKVGAGGTAPRAATAAFLAQAMQKRIDSAASVSDPKLKYLYPGKCGDTREGKVQTSASAPRGKHRNEAQQDGPKIAIGNARAEFRRTAILSKQQRPRGVKNEDRVGGDIAEQVPIQKKQCQLLGGYAGLLVGW
jgi:hypothetical protein